MTDESIFREVDEEVRQEEYKKLWQRYGNLIMAAVSAVLIAVGGYELYKYYQRGETEKASIAYFEAMKRASDGKLDDALAVLKAIKHPGYGQLAKLKEANILAEKGQGKEAVAAYDSFAADKANDAVLAQLARIRAGYISTDLATVEDIKKRVGEFDSDTSPWRHQAREILALTAFRLNDYRVADDYVRKLLDDQLTPSDMRERARVLLQLLTPNLPQE
jgi:hypothetical protein